jgi:flagellar biosynthetic protein FlhB
MEGKDGKTEAATTKKREDARKDGDLCISQDVISLVVLLLGFTGLRFAIPAAATRLTSLLASLATFRHVGTWSPKWVGASCLNGCGMIAMLMAPLIVPVMLGVVVSSMAQTGPFYSTQTLKWKFSGLNPVSGFKKLFSKKAAEDMVLTLVKIALFATAIYLTVRRNLSVILELKDMEGMWPLAWTFGLLFRITMVVMCIFTVIAVVDWVLKKRSYEKKLLMTKQAVKEERKAVEQNPLLKKAQMKKMRELSLSRMMAAVPDASVIVTNPTHVAIALKFDPETMDAPVVVARGLRLVAQRIKRIAHENGVPVLERPPLARALYKRAKLGQPIAADFFEAVAELLAYLHRIGRQQITTYRKNS